METKLPSTPPVLCGFRNRAPPHFQKPSAGFITEREDLHHGKPHLLKPQMTHTTSGKAHQLVRARRDGPGSGAVQHGDGSAGAPPRGVAIGARIERAGCGQCAKRPSCLRAPEHAMPLGFDDFPTHMTCPTACPWTSPTPVAVRPRGRALLC